MPVRWMSRNRAARDADTDREAAAEAVLDADAVADAEVVDGTDAGPDGPDPRHGPDGDGAESEARAAALAPPVDPDVEVVSGVHALAPAPAALPAIRTAAVAATGFMAGAATLALVHRHQGRRPPSLGSRRSPTGLEALPIVATRRFLVDVHLIAKPGE